MAAIICAFVLGFVVSSLFVTTTSANEAPEATEPSEHTEEQNGYTEPQNEEPTAPDDAPEKLPDEPHDEPPQYPDIEPLPPEYPQLPESIVPSPQRSMRPLATPSSLPWWWYWVTDNGDISDFCFTCNCDDIGHCSTGWGNECMCSFLDEVIAYGCTHWYDPRCIYCHITGTTDGNEPSNPDNAAILQELRHTNQTLTSILAFLYLSMALLQVLLAAVIVIWFLKWFDRTFVNV